MKHRAVFLDRDGTLIEEKGYICKFSEVTIFPFSLEAVKILNAHGFKVIVVTNQASVARGICTERQVQEIHKKIKQYFQQYSARIDAFYYCPYHEEGIVAKYRKKDEGRKPSPGMLFQAASDLGIDLSKSFMVGDSERDILAGHHAGCQTILVLTGHGRQARKRLALTKIKPTNIADNLLEAVQLIE
jgi:D-glycero-D-manno-heptose 1,7-bisphosphate phosphatase